MRKILRRLQYLLHRRQIERDLEDEMAAHREMMAADRKQSFGSSLRIREQTRDVWGATLLDNLFQDLRFALRGLRKTPGVAAMAAVTLALGIALNLALFQMVQATLLAPPMLSDPDTLVRLLQRADGKTGGANRTTAFRPETADFIRDNSSLFDAVIDHSTTNLVWGEDVSDRVSAAFVSPNYFATVGDNVVLGRTLDPNIDGPGTAPVAVVSHRLWQTRLGSDPSIAGKTIRLNELPVTVVGVASPSFPGLQLEVADDVWLPFETSRSLNMNIIRHDLYARLAPGVNDAAIREQSEPLMQNAPGAVRSGQEWVAYLQVVYASDLFRAPEDVQQALRTAATIGGLTLVVLLIACANLSNLVLSRTVNRMRELSVRAAIGASRARIFSQLLTESLLLAMLGSGLGVAVGWAGAEGIAAVMQLPSYINLTPGWQALAVAGALGILATLAIGLIPAWKVGRQDLSPSMRDGGNQSSFTMQRTRLQKLLVGAQVAGSCLLLIVAGLIVQNLRETLGNQLGYDFRGVAVMEVPLVELGIEGADARNYWQQVRDQVSGLTGVTSVALANRHPLTIGQSVSTYDEVPGVDITHERVEGQFLEAMRIPMLYGRPLTADDDPEGAMIVSRSVALAAFQKENVVGERFQTIIPIVGVVEDARFLGLMEPNSGQTYAPLPETDWNSARMVVRASDVEALLPAMRTIARQPDSRILPDAHLMTEDFERNVRIPQLVSTVSSLVALLAMTLACLSVFSVVSYATAMRTKEIGIRRALGARSSSILGLLTGQLAWANLAGIALGAVGAWQVSKIFAGEPLNMAPFSLPMLALAAAVLGAAAVLAGLIPAVRALRKDPLDALRYE